MVQNVIARFASAAGLTKAYTTHCFRWGGAQYQFMYAPIGKRWSLSKIRWWGGWAVGEHVSHHCYRDLDATAANYATDILTYYGDRWIP